MNDCIPYFERGKHPTGRATAAVIGKRFVQLTGDMTSDPRSLSATADGGLVRVGLPSAAGAAGAGKRVWGVAGYDVASGADVKVIREGIVPVTSAATCNWGDEVMCDVNGKCLPVTAGNVAVGKCIKTVTGADHDVPIDLYASPVPIPA